MHIYVHDESGYGKRFYKGCAIFLFFVSLGLYEKVISLRKELEKSKDEKGSK